MGHISLFCYAHVYDCQTVERACMFPTFATETVRAFCTHFFASVCVCFGVGVRIARACKLCSVAVCDDAHIHSHTHTHVPMVTQYGRHVNRYVAFYSVFINMQITCALKMLRKFAIEIKNNKLFHNY